MLYKYLLIFFKKKQKAPLNSPNYGGLAPRTEVYFVTFPLSNGFGSDLCLSKMHSIICSKK